MMPWSTRYCTFEWSLVWPMKPALPEQVQARIADVRPVRVNAACTMHATQVVRGVSSIENWLAYEPSA